MPDRPTLTEFTLAFNALMHDSAFLSALLPEQENRVTEFFAQWPELYVAEMQEDWGQLLPFWSVFFVTPGMEASQLIPQIETWWMARVEHGAAPWRDDDAPVAPGITDNLLPAEALASMVAFDAATRAEAVLIEEGVQP